MAAFHPAPEMLVEHATGSLTETMALLVTAHLALCPACGAEVRRLEAVGGALLEAIDPIPLREGGLESLMARLDEPAVDVERIAKGAARPDDSHDRRLDDGLRLIPEPLRSRVTGAAWRRVSGGIDEIVLPRVESGVTAKLLRIRAGQAVPRHSHTGHEYTLVLAGGFSDYKGHYGRGDLVIADSAMTHLPIADADQDCICLAVVDGGLRLAGPIGRVVGLFWRF